MPETSLLSASSSALERALERVIAQRLDALAASVPDLWSIERAPEEFLGHLAWAVSVDDWSDGWDAATKRAVIRASIPVHRRKGTPASVQDAVAAVTGQATISEWWQYDGPRHTFRIAVPPLDRPGRLGEIVRAILKTKPAHAHLNLLTMRRQIDGRARVGGVVVRSRTSRHRHDPLPRVPAGSAYAGGVMSFFRTTTLRAMTRPPRLEPGRAIVGAVLRTVRTTTLQPLAFATPAPAHPDQVYSGPDPVMSGSQYVRSTK